MERLRSAIIWSVASTIGLTAAWAQHVGVIRTGPTFRPPVNASAYGNILFPGGIPSHPQRLGATIQGYPTHSTGYPAGSPPDAGHRGRPLVVPYGVPVFFGGGGYSYPYPYQQQAAPNVTVVIPQQSTPSVIINHNYVADSARPEMRDYSKEDLPEAKPSSGMRVYEAPTSSSSPGENQARSRRAASDDRPTIYLIALSDSAVHSAIGYWIEGETLHYVTPQGSVNRVSLERLDKDLTMQLNRERKVDFELKKN